MKFPETFFNLETTAVFRNHVSAQYRKQFKTFVYISSAALVTNSLEKRTINSYFKQNNICTSTL